MRYNYKYITYRPLPESGIRMFGEWIVAENWEILRENVSPSEQVELFENTILSKLDQFCPTKVLKLSNHDKPWMTRELKQLHRQKSREYIKRGKTLKYTELSHKLKANTN